MKLFLFDIDGTILLTHGVGRRSVACALAETVGCAVDTEPISFSGKTDPQIFAEILAHEGYAPEAVQEIMPDLLACYAGYMEAALGESSITVLPGVEKLLERLAGHSDRVHLGLVTGNLEPMAYLKLARVGLADHFSFGAFGSDSAHRPDLPPLAVERAARHTGRQFAGSDVVIIGDTEHDIYCGRGIGAYAVGVCTGRFSRADLDAHDPDLLLDSLEDADPLLGLLA